MFSVNRVVWVKNIRVHREPPNHVFLNIFTSKSTQFYLLNPSHRLSIKQPRQSPFIQYIHHPPSTPIFPRTTPLLANHHGRKWKQEEDQDSGANSRMESTKPPEDASNNRFNAKKAKERNISRRQFVNTGHPTHGIRRCQFAHAWHPTHSIIRTSSSSLRPPHLLT